LRTGNILYSIRWRFVIVYLVLTVIVFAVVTVAVSYMFEDYLVRQRIDTQTKNVNTVAAQVAPYFLESDATSMYDLVLKSGNDLGGRFLVLNGSGIVQTDSFSNMNGLKLSDFEIDAILYDQNANSHGFHQVYDQAANETFWSLNCTSAIVNNGRIIGAVVYASSIRDVMRATAQIRMQMTWMYVIACAVIVLFNVVFTRFITKPVRQLTETAVKISSGDLAFRAEIKGKNEIAELGRTFNMMCDRLQNIDEQRSQFVSDASHELKTPLASMKILVESLLYQDEVKPEVYKEFLADINGEIDRMNGLVTDLLLLSKMDNDMQGINIEKLNLSALVKKCKEALLPIAEKRNISIKLTVPDEAQLEGDALKLRQAIDNLMENAVKYTPDGGHVEVTVRKQGTEVFVIIKDNGIGMSKEHLSHIFERFYRVDKARARDTGGTGLGLHIVRRVALMHGGRVEVMSEEGKGSVFTLVLPVFRPKNIAAMLQEENTDGGPGNET
jgi:two-component system OmpR family sensor kinase